MTLSIDPNVVEDAKGQFDNVSERVEELLQAELDISQIDDEDRIKEEIDSLTEELEELQEEKEGIEKDIEQVESQISTAEATLKRLQREEDENQDVLGRLKERFKENYVDDPEHIERYPEDGSHGWVKPKHIPDYFVEETGKSQEELWEIATEEVKN